MKTKSRFKIRSPRSRQTIHHVVYRTSDPFTRIDKRAIDDENLSFKALGLLVYLLSRPPNWSIRMKQLSKRGNCGRIFLQSAFKELRDHGYADLIRLHNNKGFAGTQWAIYEHPSLRSIKHDNQET